MTGNNPIPVLLLVRELGIGGCERDLTKIAIGLDRTRFEPHVACFVPEGLRAAELRSQAVPILHLNVPSFASWAALMAGRRLGAYLKINRIQVVHAFDVPTDLFAVPVARFYRSPAVIASNLSHRGLVTTTGRYLLRFSDRLAHKVVVNSKAVQQELIENEGVPPQRIVLSYNGVDTSIFHPEPRARKVFENASVVIGAVCALRREKRIDLLLEAFAGLRPAAPEARLLIVGSGPMLSSLERQAAALHLQDVCHFEPSKTEVAEWMRSIDIFVAASDSESFPNALLEAMACGCCVVGSRVGGIPELISAGRNGLLFERGNVADLTAQLAQIVSNEPLRCDLASQAVQTAHGSFSIEAAVSRMENLYLDLLNKMHGRVS